MFKISQKMRLKTNHQHSSDGISSTAHHHHGISIGNHNNNSNSENDYIFGKYHKTPEADAYPTDEHHVYIAPELTDPSKVQLLHFPSGVVRIHSDISFIIKRNGVKGNFEVKLESPSGIMCHVPLKVLDNQRFEVRAKLDEAGLYKVHIKCNSVALPPHIIISISGESEMSSSRESLVESEADA